MNTRSQSVPAPDPYHISVISRMVVCGPCGDVVGPARHPDLASETIVQRGSCPAHCGGEGKRWKGFDFDRYVELCRCCGAVAIRSGSRWSVWFCPECRERVRELNGRLGRYVVPIGRHSAHAGWVLRAGEAKDPIAVHVFAEAFKSTSDAMSALADWARVVVRRNLSDMGWRAEAVVPIEGYCRMALSHVDGERRFEGMVTYLEGLGRNG